MQQKKQLPTSQTAISHPLLIQVVQVTFLFLQAFAYLLCYSGKRTKTVEQQVEGNQKPRTEHDLVVEVNEKEVSNLD